MIKNKFFWVLFLVFGVLLLGYLAIPSPKFPAQLPGSFQSGEPADIETTLRRGYYTDLTRAEVVGWYKKQFVWGEELNYPPEEAQTIIRDQTKSTFLEEIVHPFRESIYVNGFEPQDPQYKLIVNGHQYRQKVIVRFVDSHVGIRVTAGILTLGLIYALFWGFTRKISK